MLYYFDKSGCLYTFQGYVTKTIRPSVAYMEVQPMDGLWYIIYYVSYLF